MLRTPQFYYLWGAVFCNAIAGTALISSAQVIMSDTFGNALPAIVTGTTQLRTIMMIYWILIYISHLGGFAPAYVSMLSLSNSAGRLGWSVLSDRIGRRNTYFLFGLALPVCAAIPSLVLWATIQVIKSFDDIVCL